MRGVVLLCAQLGERDHDRRFCRRSKYLASNGCHGARDGSQSESPSVTFRLMQTWREETLRDGADDATIACLDLWHSLCNKLFQARVEVRVASRREYPPTAQYTGELNTAIPICHEGLQFRAQFRYS